MEVQENNFNNLYLLKLRKGYNFSCDVCKTKTKNIIIFNGIGDIEKHICSQECLDKLIFQIKEAKNNDDIYIISSIQEIYGCFFICKKCFSCSVFSEFKFCPDCGEPVK